MADVLFWPGWLGELSIGLFALIQYGVTSARSDVRRVMPIFAAWPLPWTAFIEGNSPPPTIGAYGFCSCSKICSCCG